MNRPMRIALVLAMTMAATPVFAQSAYPTAEAAADAFVAAVEKRDHPAMQKVLGAQWRDYIPTEGIDQEDIDAFLAQWKLSHRILAEGATAKVAVGNDGWTLPIPLKQEKGGWRFDTKAGGEEMRVRRIGRNELAVLQAVQAYRDAQLDYAETDHNDDGVLEYAQRILSSDGEHDGLYWPDDDSGDVSPLGPIFGDDTPKGDYLGYRYRILTAQGPSAPGGARNYRIGDRMTRGFALVAWPAKYADTGVMSFMIGPDGQVFEKDLGPNGEALAKAMKAYDPDSSWTDAKVDATAATTP
ncbi:MULTISPECIES: DUF2950 domain-containing protein [unclassified Lysobacter]|uniref:DUF2950 domain-containing protein n=1 Tax=unclassified Lysobacter TaxID=2635362 RepID=UPI001C232835|nr:DUF2950 domain-containing protein [Lysobacter sp. MMG2]MBU8976964.1 DUF2950 domain-containing protein [Lysobacter sp. MMG2]